MSRVRGEAEDRESRAMAGRLMRLMLFMDVTLADARLLRGPAVARPDLRGSEPRRTPFSDRAPLRVMLDPALDIGQPDLANLLKLTRHTEVVEFHDCSLSGWDEIPGVKRLTITERPGFGGETAWQAATENSWHAVWLGDITAFAPRLFGVPASGTALDCAVAAEAGSTVKCDVFLTANGTFLGSADLPWWKSKVGPMALKDLSGLLSVLFRRAGFLPTSTSSTAKGGVYDVAVQRLLPSYLRLYRGLCLSSSSDRVLNYLDGLLGNCALALVALDRLACIHFDEDIDPANNVTVAQQQYESASFVVAATAALEGLTWVLLELAELSPDRRGVTFRKLLTAPRSKRDIAWVDAVVERFPLAVRRLRESFGADSALALHFRDLLQHHFPIPVAVAEFCDPSVIINGQPRFADKWKVGVLMIEPHAGEELPELAPEPCSGVLPDAVMPYPFLRGCARELYRLTDAVLGELSQEYGATGETATSLWYEDGFLIVDDDLIGMLTQHP